MLLYRRIPTPVLNTIWSRTLSRLSSGSRKELQSFRHLLIRSDIQTTQKLQSLINQCSTKHRHFSTSGPTKRNPFQNGPNGSPPPFFWFLTAAVFFTAFNYYISTRSDGNQNNQSSQNGRQNNSLGIPEISYMDFFHNMLQKGEVRRIRVFSDDMALITLKPGALYKGEILGPEPRYVLKTQSKHELEDKVRLFENQMGISSSNQIPITYRNSGASDVLLPGLLFMLITLSLFVATRKNLGSGKPPQVGGKSGKSSSSSGGFQNPMSMYTKAKFTLIDPLNKNVKGVKFSDVAGLKEAKIEVKEFVDYLKNPKKYKELGAKPPKGAIMLGPPGCGKTMLAKAVANESNVPFLSMNGSEFVEMIGGLGAARVRDLFKEARKRSPAIIYIDEIDAIGKKRSEGEGRMGGGSNQEGEQTLNQLLVEMDGLTTGEGNIIMLASTNRSDVLDKALLRPGRFDRQITIDLPTVIERKEILEQHMKGVQLDDIPEKYSERLATLTPGFSGADLANLINEAALHAARVKNEKVKKADLEYAIERVIAGPEKKTNALSPADREIVAYHESGHAIVGWMLKHTDALLKVTIIPRTNNALGFAQYTPHDKKLYSPEDLMDRMCMALGGRVAESLIFNRVTTGAQNDLEKVTKMAYSQIKYFGFNDKIGLVSFEESGGTRPYSNALQNNMDVEARKLVSEAHEKTEALLKEHHKDLEKMAQALLEKETLNYDDVESLIGPPKYGKKHLISPVDFEIGLQNQAGLGEKEAEGV